MSRATPRISARGVAKPSRSFSGLKAAFAPRVLFLRTRDESFVGYWETRSSDDPKVKQHTRVDLPDEAALKAGRLAAAAGTAPPRGPAEPVAELEDSIMTTGFHEARLLIAASQPPAMLELALSSAARPNASYQVREREHPLGLVGFSLLHFVVVSARRIWRGPRARAASAHARVANRASFAARALLPRGRAPRRGQARGRVHRRAAASGL